MYAVFVVSGSAIISPFTDRSFCSIHKRCFLHLISCTHSAQILKKVAFNFSSMEMSRLLEFNTRKEWLIAVERTQDKEEALPFPL
jgi:hypothetical protein